MKNNYRKNIRERSVNPGDTLVLSLPPGHLRLHRQLERYRELWPGLQCHEHLGEDRIDLQPNARAGGSCKNSKFRKDQTLRYLYILETGSVGLVSFEPLAARHHHVEQVTSPGSTTPGVGHRFSPGLLQPLPLQVTHQVVAASLANGVSCHSKRLLRNKIGELERFPRFKQVLKRNIKTKLQQKPES